MERDKEQTATGQRSETGELSQDEKLNPDDANGARAGQPQQGDNPKDTRMGIVNEANFGTE